MRRLITLVILAAVAVPAAAQVTPRQRTHRDSADTAFGYRLRTAPGGGFSYESFRRGRLGILVDLSADPASDSVGAKVAGVTPGGPADKAGVQTGDIVVSMNGTRLAAADAGRRENPELPEDVTPSRPGTKLIELASKLDTGDTVHLDLRRSGRPVTVTVIAGGSGLEDLVRRFAVEVAPGAPGRVRVTSPDMFFDFPGAPLANLELVPVNAGLADYFGTSEGLLVVNVPRDSSLGLKSGDVILSIGGRKPGSPAHAMRILGTYDANETVSFAVMRMKRHITVTGKMPERHGWRVTPNSFEFGPGWEPFIQHLDGVNEELQVLPHVLPRVRVQTFPSVTVIKHQVET